MGPKRGKNDHKLAKKVKLAEEKRSRAAPRTGVPGNSSEPSPTERSSKGRTAKANPAVLPTTPTATLPGATPSLTGKTSRPKQPVSKSKKTKQMTPAPIPASSSLRCQPGLDDDETLPCPSKIRGSQPEAIPREVVVAGGTSSVGETAVLGAELPGRPDDILNILPRPCAPKPLKVLLLSEKEWSANPTVREEDVTLKIPDELETEVASSRKVEDKAAELRRRALLNDKFTRESDYMYIFGCDQIFELGLAHMEPSDHRSGRIYRDFEKAGAEDIKRNLILANFVKPVLTVMPNLPHRPKDWAECVNAGKFKIINGQHTWHAAKSCLSDSILRETYPSIEAMKVWDVQVVWTDRVSHLHSLSFKCNEGQNETRHLTSLVRAILHCRVLFEQEGKPPMVRKNASTKNKKKASQSEEPTVDLQGKSKYETFRVRACQSLSHTMKQEQPEKPVRIEWEKRGERQIIMSPDHIWKKWKDVFKKYEAGELIDLDTMEEVKESSNAEDLMNLAHVNGTLLRGLASVSMESLGVAADHILSNPPRIYLGKAPKKWTYALSLDKWCERRKWKDVIVKAIGDRIHYFKNTIPNIFLDENGEIKKKTWRKWKNAKNLSSTIMQCIYFAEEADSFVSDTINRARHTPDFPPHDVLVKIDQAIVNHRRTEAVAAGNWSVFMQWRPDGRFSLQTTTFSVSGMLVTESQWRFNPYKLDAGILDLRNFPLVSEEAEEGASWNAVLKMMEVRGLKVGFKSNDAWMIIAPRNRRNVVNILRSHFFPEHRCKHVAYNYSHGEPGHKNKFPQVEITYLEIPHDPYADGSQTYLSDDVEEETIFGDQFDKREYYRAEHRDTLTLDELRMETYIRFIGRHSRVNHNVILGFAGAKALMACRMMKRNTISFESISVGSAETLYKAVTEAPSLWRTYYLPNRDNMVGDNVDQYDPKHTQALVNYEIHPDVSLGGFYTCDNSQNLRLSQTSVAGTVSTQETAGLDSPCGDMQTSRTAAEVSQNRRSTQEARSKSDDAAVTLQSYSEDNDVCSPHCSASDYEDAYEDEDHFDKEDMNDVSSQSQTPELESRPSHAFEKGKELLEEPEAGGHGFHLRSEEAAAIQAQKEDYMRAFERELESEDGGHRVHLRSAEAAANQARQEAALIALQREKQRRDDRSQSHTHLQVAPRLLSSHEEEVIEMSQREVGTQEPDGLCALTDSVSEFPRLRVAGVFPVGDSTIAAPLNHALQKLLPLDEEPDSARETLGVAVLGAVDSTSSFPEVRKLNFTKDSSEKPLQDNPSSVDVDEQSNLGDVNPSSVCLQDELHVPTAALQAQHGTEESMCADALDVPGSQRSEPTPDAVLGEQEDVQPASVSEPAMPTPAALSAADNIEMSEREEARRAEEAWRLKDKKTAEKRAKEAEELRRENELFLKKFAKPPPNRILLNGDSSSDDEDEIVRARLLRKFDCVLPAKGTRAVNRGGLIHCPVIAHPEKPEPEPIQVPTSLHPTSSGPGTASFTFPPLTLEEEIYRDVKTELVEERWMRKRKAEIDLELTERVNKKFAESKQDLLKSIYDDFHAGRVPFPFPEPLSRPGNRSEIQSGISNAGSPVVPPLVIPTSTAAVIPDPSIALVPSGVDDMDVPRQVDMRNKDSTSTRLP